MEPISLHYATHRLNDLLRQHFTSNSGPRKLLLAFSSLKPWCQFRDGGYQRMDGFRELDPVQCELPHWFVDLKRAVTEFLLLASSSSTFRLRAVEFGNLEWVRKLEGGNEEDYCRDSGGDPELKFKATLTLAPYDPAWLPTEAVDVEATQSSGLPDIRVDEELLILDGKSYRIRDQRILRALAVIVKGYPDLVKGAAFAKVGGESVSNACRVFNRKAWKDQPRELRIHLIPGHAGFVWVK